MRLDQLCLLMGLFLFLFGLWFARAPPPQCFSCVLKEGYSGWSVGEITVMSLSDSAELMFWENVLSSGKQDRAGWGGSLEKGRQERVLEDGEGLLWRWASGPAHGVLDCTASLAEFASRQQRETWWNLSVEITSLDFSCSLASLSSPFKTECFASPFHFILHTPGTSRQSITVYSKKEGQLSWCCSPDISVQSPTYIKGFGHLWAWRRLKCLNITSIVWISFFFIYVLPWWSHPASWL